MIVSGLESIRHTIQLPGFFAKCILTDSAAILFPGSVQHRDIKQHGASYEDDYRGNALAATISPGTIDVRYHLHFSDERVRSICSQWLRMPEMAWAAFFMVTYQGRRLLP